MRARLVRRAVLGAAALAAGCHLIGGAGDYTIVDDAPAGGTTGVGGSPCAASGSCPDGSSCDGATVCASGHCVDGRCCDTPCDALCSACDVAGHEGECRPLDAATDPAMECAPGTCDGSGACVVGSFGWLLTFGSGSQTTFVTDVAVDAASTVVVGRFRDGVDFGAGVVTSAAGKHDGFIAKYRADRSSAWVKALGNGTQDLFVESVAIDSGGNVVVVGRFREPVDFGAGLVPSVAGAKYDAFVAKYSAEGSLMWLYSFGNGVHDQHANDVAVDDAGNVAIVGELKLAVDFGGGSTTSVSDKYDAYVVSYDPSGGFRWVNTFGNGVHDQHASAIEMDAAGSVLAVGRFKLSVDFGGGPTASVSDRYDAFLVKYTAAGGYQWSATFGNGTQDQHAEAVGVDSAGAALVGGRFKEPVDFGGGDVLPSGASYDAYLIKYDSEGGFAWSRTFGDGLIDQHATAVAVDLADHAIVAGRIEGGVDFGAGPVSSAGAAYDAYTAKYDRHGTLLWARTWGNGLEDQSAEGVAAGQSGEVVVAGQFRGIVDFGGGAVSSLSPTQDDGFVLGLAP